MLQKLASFWRTSFWPALFWNDERGQDLVEYSLLLTFVSLVGIAMFIGMRNSAMTLWTLSNSQLAAGNETS